ncbi:hypothetical protein GP486_000358 [Trichoglossum hirsutum]|uniref:Ricin B lectin domain-containing protein n=1 Tax=Trichoglossum hirsutum TaxID=265104 RepID=A0A9P8RU12_9PEZI|nr:hypothetical protein GP486_000358 [Trichoglossum hirsutum]
MSIQNDGFYLILNKSEGTLLYMHDNVLAGREQRWDQNEEENFRATVVNPSRSPQRCMFQSLNGPSAIGVDKFGRVADLMDAMPTNPVEWDLIPSGNYFELQNVRHGTYLTQNPGGRITAGMRTGSDIQLWKLIRVDNSDDLRANRDWLRDMLRHYSKTYGKAYALIGFYPYDRGHVDFPNTNLRGP